MYVGILLNFFGLTLLMVTLGLFTIIINLINRYMFECVNR